ncbi:MAG: transcription antitermination factor NusB [Actinobacteria bacterium]|nr:transcription antitermination factor NusB [Actinomycetota bacterium]
MERLSRRNCREKAIILLYQKDLLGKSVEDILSGDSSIGREYDEFTLRLVKGVVKNIGNIDRIIKTVVENWSLERIAIIDRNIIRVAIYEMVYEEEIPLKVSVDEAIEISKTLGQKDDTPKFINGILGKVLNDICNIKNIK